MKTVSKIGLLLFSVCSIGMLLYYLNKTPTDRGQQPVVTEVNPEIINTDITSASVKGISLGAVSDEAAISLFESSGDSGESLQLIQQLFADGKDVLAKALLDELHRRCGYKAYFEPTPDTRPWVFEKVVRYCENYDSSLYNKLLSEGVEFKIANPNILSLTSSEETDIDILSKDFLDMLTQMNYSPSHFMFDVSNTIGYFSGDLGIHLNLGQSDNINSFHVSKVQSVAIELYECQKFGGCGVDSHQVLSYCFIDRSCVEGWSLMDYYQNTLSQVNFNEVMNILSFIQRYERANQP